MALTRSEQMSRIRGADTKPELLLRKALWNQGLRYRVRAVTPVGRPDVVFPGTKVAVFVDGCQWHGCPDHYVFPRTRREFWGAKLAGNVARDRRQTLELEALGWTVVRVWEHRVFTDLDGVVGLVSAALSGQAVPSEAGWRVVRVDPLPEGDDMERRHLEDIRDASTQHLEVRRRSSGKWSRKPAAG
jgi:DNA mismatch endonuclease, patch repair protein